MTAEPTTNSVRVRKHIPAPPADVFAAWTQPEKLRLWSAPTGVDVPEADVDLRVGGSYRIQMRNEEGEVFTAYGTYREIQPGRRLVYTWNWSEERHAVGETVVTVEFEAAGQGTHLTLTHGGFPSVEAAEGHEFGWNSCLERLSPLLEEAPAA